MGIPQILISLKDSNTSPKEKHNQLSTLLFPECSTIFLGNTVPIKSSAKKKGLGKNFTVSASLGVRWYKKRDLKGEMD